jgi:hypothetical protein
MSPSRSSKSEARRIRSSADGTLSFDDETRFGTTSGPDPFLEFGEGEDVAALEELPATS